MLDRFQAWNVGDGRDEHFDPCKCILGNLPVSIRCLLSGGDESIEQIDDVADRIYLAASLMVDRCPNNHGHCLGYMADGPRGPVGAIFSSFEVFDEAQHVLASQNDLIADERDGVERTIVAHTAVHGQATDQKHDAEPGELERFCISLFTRRCKPAY